jgi:hypothetical protein
MISRLIKSGAQAANAGTGQERAGHKYLSRKWVGDRWVYDYGDGDGREPAAQDQEEQPARTQADPATDLKARAALARAFDHPSLPAGFSVEGSEHTYTRRRGVWEDEEGTRIGDGAALAARLEREETSGKVGGALTLKQALWAFLEGAVPGSDPTWKIRAGLEEDPRSILARNRAEQDRAGELRGENREQDQAEANKQAEARTQERAAQDEARRAEREAAVAERDKARTQAQEEKGKAREAAQAEKEAARAEREKGRAEARAAKEQETVAALREKLEAAKQDLKTLNERRLLSRDLEAARAALEAAQDTEQGQPQAGEDAGQAGEGTSQAAAALVDGLDPKEAAASVEATNQERALQAFGVGEDAAKDAAPSEGQSAALRLVDDGLLNDLKGKDKLAALKTRAPEVAKGLAQSLAKLGTQRPAVQARAADLLARENWNGSARAQMLGALLDNQDARRNATALMDAAESLAAGGKVEPHHVAGAIAMRGMGAGQGEGAWADNVKAIGQDAERELARLQGLLAQARQNPAKAREALGAALSSGAVQKIATLAKAFPGLQDKATAAARDVEAQASALAPREGLATHGASAPLFVAGEMGRATSAPARYRLMEAHDVVPSHDPETWAKNGAYPEGIQERLYHSDKAEQNKVERNARNLEPAFVVNTNPDALNGPPVITPEGHVLGGNSRAMSMQLAYRQGGEKASALRKHLTDNAHHFGFRPEDVQAMVNPVLVREATPESSDPAHLRKLVRLYNEGHTQAMDPKALSVALSSKLGEDVIHNLAGQMEAGESLAEFLDSPRSRSFVEALDRAGVIDERNANAYKERGGKLNADGRRLVERALVGKVVGDADLLHRLPDSLITGLARSVPSLYQAEGAGKGYNIREPLKAALDGYATMHARGRQGGVGVPPSDASPEVMRAGLSQLKGDLFGEDHPATSDPRAAKILEALVRRPGSRQIANAFSDFAAQAQANPEGQASLFGPSDPSTVLHGALDRLLRQPQEQEQARTQGEPSDGQEATPAPPSNTEPREAGAPAPASNNPATPASDNAPPADTSSPAPEVEAPPPATEGQASLFGGGSAPRVPEPESEEDDKPAPNPNQGLLLSMARGLLARNRALAMPASVRAGEVWGDDGGAHEDVGGVGELENLSGGGVDAQDREPYGTGEAGGSFEVDPCVGVPDFGEVV